LNYVDRIKTVCLRGLINLGVGGWALSQSLIGLIRLVLEVEVEVGGGCRVSKELKMLSVSREGGRRK
jgi:phosphoribosylformimino-5-aminoimidazole carboxamide ribonucleotide (ProFAR) isomerase